ncbi:MAG: hypothetical protein RMJ43_08345 [Chloroherpetonaceae bacterium]|nr:hypothetical protein [Chthonomonadaceae bacterium]MDW8207831.1 hypothetical protein [Chloroherpetonaceae bacterium]
MRRWQRYLWLGGVMSVLLLALWLWYHHRRPSSLPAVPPGAEARMEDAPDHRVEGSSSTNP